MSLPQLTAFACGRLKNVVLNANGLAVFGPPDRPALRNIEALRHDNLDVLRVVESANANRMSEVASHEGGTLPGVAIVGPSSSQLPVLEIERKYCSL